MVGRLVIMLYLHETAAWDHDPFGGLRSSGAPIGRRWMTGRTPGCVA